ncbi:MAG TPA: hypothetical protein VGI75_00085 [Pirellulales bacterium]
MTKQELAAKYYGQEEILCKLAGIYEGHEKHDELFMGAEVFDTIVHELAELQDEAAAHGICLKTMEPEEFEFIQKAAA